MLARLISHFVYGEFRRQVRADDNTAGVHTEWPMRILPRRPTHGIIDDGNSKAPLNFVGFAPSAYPNKPPKTQRL